MILFPSLLALAFVALVALVWKVCPWFMQTLPEENDMDYPTNPAPRARVVQTYPGDSLSQGICRARVLTVEYAVVVLIHDLTPVTCFPGDEADDIAAEWWATKNALAELGCKGK